MTHRLHGREFFELAVASTSAGSVGRKDQIARRELSVPIPVAAPPIAIQVNSIFKSSVYKDLDHVAAVELHVQVGVSYPGAFQVVHPHLAIGKVDNAVVVQVEGWIAWVGHSLNGLQVQVTGIQLAVIVVVAFKAGTKPLAEIPRTNRQNLVLAKSLIPHGNVVDPTLAFTLIR